MGTAEAIDIVWILSAAALVMLMQAGFSALESGLVRTKNSINVAAKNFSDFLLSTAVFWIAGFAIMFGSSTNGMFGSSDFFFGAGASPFLTAFFIFQMGFVGTAATIVSGAVAERMRFSSYLIVTLVVSALLYPVFGHWAWSSAAGLGGTGWLESIGFIDFAGSTVVHSVGGWTALAALLVIGPRAGRFGTSTTPIHGHDLPLVTVGVFILWFGWFGFNGGSTLGLTPEVPSVILNTTISASFGGMSALAISWFLQDRPDVPTIMNGALAGLVAITASANIVTPVAAVAIGIVAAAVMFAATRLLERFEIDDAVGAVPVHLAAGVWGTLAVALVGDTGAFGEGVTRAEQLLVQSIGAVAAFAWVFGLAYAILRTVDRLRPLRIGAAGELDGLNIAEHGASTVIADLLADMDRHRATGDYSVPVAVEPHTEAGRIAQQYNRVLATVHREKKQRESAVRALRDRSASLQLLQSITAAVNEEQDLEAAYETALREVCEFTGWSVGHVYASSSDGELLSPTRIWQMDDDALSEFVRLTGQTPFLVGEGLPGLAAERRRTERMTISEDTAWNPRLMAASRAGLRSGYAFPVFAGPDVVAVMEFFSLEPPEELSDGFLRLMTAVGTQLGRAIERRRADEARFRTVVDHMPAMVLLRDLDGRFLLANRRYEEFYKVANQALEGRTLAEVAKEAPELGQWLLADESLQQDHEVLRTNRTLERELDMTIDGQPVVLASVKFPIPGPTGETIALGGIEIDITERKNHEAELAALVEKVEMARDEALRATQAKSRFLANMSHELRTPLNAIIGFARLVRRKTAGHIDQRQADNLGKILQSAEHLMSLINDILDLSRIEAGRLEVFPTMVEVGSVLDEVVGSLDPLASESGLSLVASTQGRIDLFTDEEKLRQVLINLVGNAVKFTPEGRVDIHAAKSADRVEIEVADTGIGISEEDMQRIFDEFEQVDTGPTRTFAGTGLGLSISNRLVRLLGGNIAVRSTVGQGSVFTIRLPLRYEASIAPGALP
ncbi:MAG: ammonium transporter [Actinobacteria bacterium]|nr:MAG: ammonium transporter [Actinomycetota bacterium]REK42306.1 MAG: ammonium transporter [Actinomycetota bacterium]